MTTDCLAQDNPAFEPFLSHLSSKVKHQNQAFATVRVSYTVCIVVAMTQSCRSPKDNMTLRHMVAQDGEA